MVRLTRIRLVNMTPLHIGKGRDSYEVASPILSSDALSSALASVRAMRGKVHDINAFLESFVISTAFPFAGNEFFLPRPNGHLDIRVKNLEEKEYRKGLKKLKYIAEPIWNQLVSGVDIEIEKSQLCGEFLLSSSNSKCNLPTVRVSNQRVKVPRIDNKDAMPFSFEWTFFRHGDNASGLYCLLDAEPARREEIINLFEILGSLGIGSDKSVGGGHFDIKVDEVDLPTNKGNNKLLLSCYIPTVEELSQLHMADSSYSLIKRGGFIAGSSIENKRQLRKKTVYMFEAGSVFSTQADLKGKVVELTPNWDAEDMHPVYRSGRPLYVNVNMHTI